MNYDFFRTVAENHSGRQNNRICAARTCVPCIDESFLNDGIAGQPDLRGK